ncbi:MAG TPA: CHAD domain-containing protein [Deltaproteobacteria bacterium]|nr:CHAD domain-containing protein [Deltaproteobacteria bacterium]
MKKPDHPLSEVLLRRWGSLLRIRHACLENGSAEEIHDLRVASRRMRAALKLADVVVPCKSISRLNVSVRKLTRKSGHIRNMDEFIQFLKELSEGDTCRFDLLIDSLTHQRCAESDSLNKVLRRFDADWSSRRMQRVMQRMDNGNRQCMQSLLSSAGIECFRNVQLYLTFLLDRDAAEARHALRIAIKRWRYLVEIAAEVSGADYGPLLNDLKVYQGLLGRLNDLTVFQGWAASLEIDPDDRNLLVSASRSAAITAFQSLEALAEDRPLRYSFL